jgi:hypothetical protein
MIIVPYWLKKSTSIRGMGKKEKLGERKAGCITSLLTRLTKFRVSKGDCLASVGNGVFRHLMEFSCSCFPLGAGSIPQPLHLEIE